MNEGNLMKLAAYLLKGNPTANADFTMRVFYDDDTASENSPTCGSAGCAVGHGPFAGIPKHYYEDWVDYSARVFGWASPHSVHIDDDVFDWCFSYDWADTDNTPKGAGKRILHLLRHGLPENFVEQIYGDAPLSYLDERL